MEIYSILQVSVAWRSSNRDQEPFWDMQGSSSSRNVELAGYSVRKASPKPYNSGGIFCSLLSFNKREYCELWGIFQLQGNYLQEVL